MSVFRRKASGIVLITLSGFERVESKGHVGMRRRVASQTVVGRYH